MIGRKLSHFVITAKLGEGGMGEVYRADDTKLGRQVAIKVLPAAFTEDAERLTRFEREARLLAQLQHPHIASIFGLEESDGVQALVMELVEGPTLDDRLRQGPLPLAEALAILCQIAEALEEAHGKGIVHRDLKPQNIKAPAEGEVKVLDFGLAKAFDPMAAVSGDASPSQLAASPTLTLGATAQGVILGTAAYMSPEQAKGSAVGKQADIWAFGVILYEMLTGKRLFEGDSVAETLAGVLKNEIDLDDLPPETPRAVRRLLGRCLERRLKDRLHDIADARLELEDARAKPPPLAVEPTSVQPVPLVPWLLAGVLAVALGAVLVWAILRPAGTGSLFLTVSQLTQSAGLEVQPSISPDGKLVAYASDADGDWDIYVVRAVGGTAINLTRGSPDDDLEPAFSPGGERIAFRSERDGGGLFDMGAAGESVRRLTDHGFNPSWSPDGRLIAFSTESIGQLPNGRQTTARLWTVDVETGATTKLLDTLDAVEPDWSPNGLRIAFWGVLDRTGQRDVWTVAADGSGAVPVTADIDLDWSPVWSPDGRFLYFSSNRAGSLNLWRVAIDERSGEVLSPLEPMTTPSRWSGQLTFATDGITLAYTVFDRRINAERVTFDPERFETVGVPEAVTRGTVQYHTLSPSPDGEHLALTTSGQREDLWILDLEDHNLRRLTDDPANDRGVFYSPDGRYLLWYSDRSGTYEAWRIRPDGSGLEQLTRSDSADRVLTNPVWSPDGRRLVADNRVFDLTGSLPAAVAEEFPEPADGRFTVSSWSGDGHRIAGRILAAVTAETLPGVVLYDIEAKSYDRLSIGDRRPAGNGAVFWLADDRHLVVAADDDVILVDSENGEWRPLLVAPAGSHYIRPSVTRDGRTLYYLRVEEEADLWIAKLGEGP